MTIIQKTRFLLFPIFIWSMNGIAQNDPNIKYNKNCTCFGVINDTGDTIVPFDFQKIEFKPFKYYQVYRTNEKEKTKTGLYDIKGRIIVPVENNSIKIDEAENFLVYYSDQVTGVYFQAFNKHIFVPGLHYFRKYKSKIDSITLYVFSNEQGSEIFDSNLNSVLKSNENIHYPYFLDSPSNKFNFIYGPPGKKKYGVLNSQGEILIPAEYETLEGPSDYYALFGTGYEIIASNRKTYDYYPMDELNSVYHFDYMNFWNGVAIAKESGKWKLFDENVNTIYEDGKYALSFQTEHFNPKEIEYRDMLCEGCTFYQEHLMTTLNPVSKILFRISYGKPKKNCGGIFVNCIKKHADFGLFNFETKESTQVEYNFILVNSRWYNWELRKEPKYFWCLKLNETHEDVKLDIFDAQLKKTLTYSLNDSSLYFLKYQYAYQLDSTVQVLQNSIGNFGLLNPNGTINTPFNYKRHVYLQGKTNHFHLFGDSQFYGLIDNHGKKIASINYDTLFFLDRDYQIIFVGIKNNLFTFISTDDGILMDGINMYFESYREPELDKSKDQYSKTYYAILNEQLYVLDYNQLVLMNDKRLQFLDTTKKTVEGIIIDRTGKIISYPDKYRTRK